MSELLPDGGGGPDRDRELDGDGGRGDAEPGRWHPVAEGVLVQRRQPYDVTCVLIMGDDGRAVLVDPHAGHAHGTAIRRSLPAAGVRVADLAAVVVTHPHLDHWLGASAFPEVPLWSHAAAPAELVRHLAAGRAELTALDPTWDAATEVPRQPDHLVAPGSPEEIVLGARTVVVVALPRAHSGADLYLHVPDADVVVAGDLVESAGPLSVGPDSDPQGWLAALAELERRTGPETVVVPGHGPSVGREFVRAQLRSAAAGSTATESAATGSAATGAAAGSAGRAAPHAWENGGSATTGRPT